MSLAIHRSVIILVASMYCCMCYGAAGDLDTSFGSSGLVEKDFVGGDNWDMIKSIAVQTDGRILLAGTVSEGTDYTHDFLLMRYNADGSPDTAFGGGDGIATTSFWPGSKEDAYSMAVQPGDNRIVVAGIIESVSGWSDFALARYNPDGTLDPTFGTSGLVTTDFGADTNDLYPYLVLLPDGKILIAGTIYDGNSHTYSIGLVRYLSDGSLDVTFGTGGKANNDVTTIGDEVIRDIALQDDGKIVVAGTNYCHDKDFDWIVVRFNSNGSPDSGFGAGGVSSIDYPNFASDQASGISVQPGDGKILVAGTTEPMPGNNGAKFGLARLNTDGTLDSTFGSGGLVTTAFRPVQNQCGAEDLLLQPDGKIIAVGWSQPNLEDADFAMARFLVDGSLDTTFGSGGLVTTDFHVTSDDYGETAALQADGRIVLAGYQGYVATPGDPHVEVSLARYIGYTPSSVMLFDDFEDSSMNWLRKKGSWQESNGVLTGSGETAVIYAPHYWTPSGLTGCAVCTIETDLQTAGGAFTRVFLTAWFRNGSNKVDLMMNEPGNKWVLKQKAGDAIVKVKAFAPIEPGVNYHVSLSYDGASFHLSVDGIELITLPAAAAPFGTVGYKVKNTSASFRQIVVY